MEEQDTEDTVAEHPPEDRGLPLGQHQQAQDEGEEEEEHAGSPDEALLLADGAEDEVGILLRHVVEFGLRAVHEAFSGEPPGADGDFRLVDVVGCVAVLLNAEQHADARALVILEDMVQREVGKVEESHAADGEHGDEEPLRQPLAHPHPAQVGRHEDIEADDSPRNVVGHKGGGDGPRHHVDGKPHPQQVQRVFALAGQVDAHHCYGEQPNHVEDDVLPHVTEAAGQGSQAVTDADHEVGHGGHGTEKDDAGHALAVEHQAEGAEDEGGPRLLLHDDEEEGEQHHGSGAQQATGLVEGEAVLVDQFGQGEGGGALGELGGLQTDGAEGYPRARALDIVGNEGGDEEHNHHQPVEDVGKDFVIPVLYHQDDGAQAEGTGHPHQLLARPRPEREEVGIAHVVAGSAHADPSEGKEHQIHQQHPAIGTEYGIYVSFAHRFLCCSYVG